MKTSCRLAKLLFNSALAKVAGLPAVLLLGVLPNKN
jgi:hypothetical protein